MAMARLESHVREDLLAASDEVIEDAVTFADSMVLRGLLYQLTGDEGCRVRERKPHRLGEQRVAGEDRRRLVELRPGARASTPDLVVVEGRQVVVDEREVVHELDRCRCGEQLFGLPARGLTGRETEHWSDPLAPARERIADRLRQVDRTGSKRSMSSSSAAGWAASTLRSS